MTTVDDKNSDTVEAIGKSKAVIVEIPGRLAARVTKFAEENGISFTNAVVEALDQFLRGKK